MNSEQSKETVRVTVKDVELAVKKGYPITCSTCEHHHAAVAIGNPTCGKFSCGGPILNRNFPDYKGQIARTRFETICLMCGSSEIICHVLVPSKSQKFGLCLKHKSTFDNVVTNPTIGLPQTSPVIVPIV